ncbi:MAG: hypothetical protein V7782_11255 [Psychromonas sp.]
MFKKSIYLLSICTALFSPYSSAKLDYDNTFNIIISEKVKNDYLLFLNGRDPLNINDFSGLYSGRDVVETILVQQALFFGGNRQSYNLITSDSSLQTIERLYDGSALISGTSVWQSKFVEQDNIYFSLPVINNGQFESAIYTHPENAAMLAVDDIQKLRQRRAISNKNWNINWYTLQSLNVAKVWHAEEFPSMVAMVNNHQADFLIAPFQSTEDLSLVLNNIRLVPVPNVKVALRGSRHFAISKNSKQSKVILQQLNRGLYLLKSQGIIKQAYEQSGFFNTEVKDWKRLN